MASNAIYSEVIALELNLSSYEDNIKAANSAFENLIKNMKSGMTSLKESLKISMDGGVAAIDNAIRIEQQYNTQIKLGNDLIRERRKLLAAADNKAFIDLYGAKTNTSDFLAKQRQDRYVMEAQYESQIQAATIKKFETEQLLLVNREKQNAAIREQLKLMNDAIAVEKKSAEAAALAQRNSVQGRVGSLLSGSTVGSGLMGLSSIAFMTGSAGIGGSIYMLERMTYAMGIGRQKLSEFIADWPILQSVISGANTALGIFGESMVGFGAAIAAVAGPITAMIAGNKLDKAVADMSTLLADINIKGSAFTRMMNDAASAAARLSESFDMNIVDTVKGFKVALSTGISADNLEQFGTIAATVAKSVGTSFDDAVGILTTFKDAYGLNTKAMAESSDILFNAINIGKFQVDDLKQNIGRVAVSASEAGVELKDMMAGLVVLSRIGLSTSQSITSLNRMIQGIINPTAEAKKHFDALGLATGIAAFKTQTLMQYMAQLRVVTGGNAEVMAKLFTTEQGRRGALGITTNAALSEQAVEGMQAVGTATEAANRAMNTFGQNFSKIFTAVWDVVQEIGRDLLQTANAVFFGNGPLSTDNLSSIKLIIEEVGIAFKLVGQIVITIAAAIYHALNMVVSTLTAIGALAGGEVKAAWRMFHDAASSAGKGAINAFSSLAESLNASQRRIVELTNGTKQFTDDGVKPLKDSVNEVIPMFSEEFTKALGKVEKKGKSVFDEMIEAIHKTRVELAKLNFDSEYKPTPIGSTAPSKSYIEMDNRLAAARAHAEAKFNSIDSPYKNDPERKATMISGFISKELGRTEEEWLAVMASAKKATEATYKETKAREEATNKIEAWNKYVDKIGLPDAKIYEEVQTGSKNRPSDNAVLATLEDALFLAGVSVNGKGIATKGVRSVKETSGGEESWMKDVSTSIGYVTNPKQVTTRDMTLKEQLGAARDAKAVVNALQILDSMPIGISIIPNKAAFEDTVEVIESTYKKAQVNYDKSVSEGYKKEVEAAIKLYNTKMQFYSKEEERLNTEILLYDKLTQTIKQQIFDRNAKARGPEYEFRQARDAANSGLTQAAKAKTDGEFKLAVENIKTQVDRMISGGNATGGSYINQAIKDANEIQSKLLKLLEGRKGTDTKEQTDISDLERMARAALNTSIKDNPVGQAAIAAATVVLKESVLEAAKHGIGVTGDLKQDIKVPVNVNLDVNEFKQIVQSWFKISMTQYFNDVKKGANDRPDTKQDPVGAPSTDNLYNTDAGKNVTF